MSGSLKAILEDAHTRLLEKDSSIWGESAQELARERLGWIDLPERSRQYLPALDALSAWARENGLYRIVLSGMGGSSLAPEVIAMNNSRDLILLDSTHPDDVHTILDPQPDHTLFVLSSKSGETVETLSHLKAIEERLQRAACELREHLVIISDPESPLATWAASRNVKYFPGELDVGGRFSALSLFGLIPSALLGIDCATLLDDALEQFHELHSDSGRERAIQLAREIIEGEPYLHLPIAPLSNWIEQLIAESTGKVGRGIIPVIASKFHAAPIAPQVAASFTLPIGSAFFLWEWVTALIGAAMKLNPFDQPNVASAKRATQETLQRGISLKAEVHRESSSLLSALRSTWSHTQKEGLNRYLALLAFAPSHSKETSHALASIHSELERVLASRITVNFGPRYLHSTGQCHKGGPDLGNFLIITVEPESDYEIRGENFTFNELLLAQAIGDFQTFKELGRPVLHAHLTMSELEKFSRALREVS